MITMEHRPKSVKATRVILVDDQPLYLDLAKTLLSRDPRVTVVGEATTVKTAVLMIKKLEPDLVMLDVHMPDMNGFEAARILLASNPGLRLILTSSQNEPEYHYLATTVGALGFITKKELTAEAVIRMLEQN